MKTFIMCLLPTARLAFKKNHLKHRKTDTWKLKISRDFSGDISSTGRVRTQPFVRKNGGFNLNPRFECTHSVTLT